MLVAIIIGFNTYNKILMPIIIHIPSILIFIIYCLASFESKLVECFYISNLKIQDHSGQLTFIMHYLSACKRYSTYVCINMLHIEHTYVQIEIIFISKSKVRI